MGKRPKLELPRDALVRVAIKRNYRGIPELYVWLPAEAYRGDSQARAKDIHQDPSQPPPEAAPKTEVEPQPDQLPPTERKIPLRKRFYNWVAGVFLPKAKKHSVTNSVTNSSEATSKGKDLATEQPNSSFSTKGKSSVVSQELAKKASSDTKVNYGLSSNTEVISDLTASSKTSKGSHGQEKSSDSGAISAQPGHDTSRGPWMLLKRIFFKKQAGKKRHR